jgi:hypothetical protein
MAELDKLFGGARSSSASNLLTCMQPKLLAPGIMPEDKAYPSFIFAPGIE